MRVNSLNSLLTRMVVIPKKWMYRNRTMRKMIKCVSKKRFKLGTSDGASSLKGISMPPRKHINLGRISRMSYDVRVGESKHYCNKKTKITAYPEEIP